MKQQVVLQDPLYRALCGCLVFPREQIIPRKRLNDRALGGQQIDGAPVRVPVEDFRSPVPNSAHLRRHGHLYHRLGQPEIGMF